jgi:hypothetical protein
MKIISHRQRVECERFSREFRWKDSPGAGFSFDCDKDGNVDLKALQKKPAAFKNYQDCITGAIEVEDHGIHRYSWNYVEPAIGLCPCGCKVELDSFTNTCDGCERDFNMSGQELAPRSQWGEETGEHWSDCI